MIVALSQVAEINPKSDLPAHIARDEMLDFLPMADVSESGMVSVTTQRRLSEVQKGFTAFRKGDILIAKITPCFENNKIAVADIGTEVGFGSTEFHVVRCARSKLDSRYLLYLLRSNDVRAEGKRRMTGSAGQQRVPKKFLEDLQIPLPPLAEQKRIAAILDQADELRRKRQRAINRLNQLGQAIFYEMFGEWDQPGSNIPTLPLGDYLDFLTSGSRGWAEYYSDSGDLFLRIQNVKRDELDLSDVAYVDAPDSAEARRTRVQAGDVLLSITADLGRTAVIPDNIGNAYINQHLAIIRTNSFNPRFLSAALSSPAGQRAILKRNREGVKAGLNFDDVRSVRIPETTMEHQISFAKRLQAVDKLKKMQTSARRDADRLFASLQHRAFQGEL